MKNCILVGNLKTMSDDFKQIRNRTLIVTEGHHEKTKLIKKLLLSFPEIKIDFNNIVMYESNIYNLYTKIVNDYGEDWEEQDVDLPMSVSRWKNFDVELSKENFTNVILIFDYERHDPNFSEETICKLQKYFSDITDVGQLYLNYPMVESYLDFNDFEYNEFKNKKFEAHISNGKKYKTHVSKSKLFEIFEVFDKLISILNNEVHDPELSENIITDILRINNSTDLVVEINSILIKVIDTKRAKTLAHQFERIIYKLDYLSKGLNYFEYLKSIFISVIHSNIRKAYYIQEDFFELSNEMLKNIYFDYIDLYKVLIKQNEASRDDSSGFIWILNSSVFIASNYKSFWN